MTIFCIFVLSLCGSPNLNYEAAQALLLGLGVAPNLRSSTSIFQFRELLNSKKERLTAVQYNGDLTFLYKKDRQVKIGSPSMFDFPIRTFALTNAEPGEHQRIIVVPEAGYMLSVYSFPEFENLKCQRLGYVPLPFVIDGIVGIGNHYVCWNRYMLSAIDFKTFTIKETLVFDKAIHGIIKVLWAKSLGLTGGTVLVTSRGRCYFVSHNMTKITHRSDILPLKFGGDDRLLEIKEMPSNGQNSTSIVILSRVSGQRKISYFRKKGTALVKIKELFLAKTPRAFSAYHSKKNDGAIAAAYFSSSNNRIQIKLFPNSRNAQKEMEVSLDQFFTSKFRGSDSSLFEISSLPW